MTAVFICLYFFILSSSLFCAICLPPSAGFYSRMKMQLCWFCGFPVWTFSLFNHYKEVRVIFEMDLYEMNPRVS